MHEVTVLVFMPHPDDKDQEVRAVVKIGADDWTLTARGSSRAWGEMLLKVGPGKILHQVSQVRPVRTIPPVRATIEE